MGRGHIYQSAKNSWVIKISTGLRRPSGSYITYYETVHGAKKDAEQRLAEVLPLAMRGALLKPIKIVPPVEIQESYGLFRKDYPLGQRTAFIMMKYRGTSFHRRITLSIKNTLASYDIRGLLANDKAYHDQLYYNIMTYLYGCDLGIVVFERIEEEEFNPNVALELGFMLALDKPICILKEKTLAVLHTDIVGKIYRNFDIQSIDATIKEQLVKWLTEKSCIK